MESIKVIGFDADDTLWVNGSYFLEAEKTFCELLSDYMTPDELSHTLYQTEVKNLKWYGYGVMAYTLSLVETAIAVSQGKIPASVIQTILELGRRMLSQPVQLYPGVKETLPALQQHYKLIVITKGDLLDQQRKLEKSGLMPYFHHLEVVSEKQSSNYLKLINVMGIQPSEFLMVGNSLKSDIIPVLTIGGKAVHIPQKEVWQQEKSGKPSLPYIEIDSMEQLGALFQL